MAVLLMREGEQKRRETNEQVDEILEPRYRTEDEIHDIPIVVHVTTDPHETPVETTDNQQDERDNVQCFHVSER